MTRPSRRTGARARPIHIDAAARRFLTANTTLGRRTSVLFRLTNAIRERNGTRPMRVSADEAHADVAMGRALDPARGENPVGVGIDQQRQHHRRMILRAARAPVVYPERRKRNPLDRGNEKMRQIIARQPILQIRRQKKGLVALQTISRSLNSLPPDCGCDL